MSVIGEPSSPEKPIPAEPVRRVEPERNYTAEKPNKIVGYG